MIKRLVTVVILSALGLALGPPAMADDIVNLTSGSSATLPATANALVLFPISTVGQVPVSNLAAGVVRVVREGRPVPTTVIKAVKASIDPGLPALALAVDVDALDRVGEYTVTVAVTSGEQHELVDLVLLRTSASIQAPVTIEVRRTVLLPELGWCLHLCSDESPELRLIAGYDTRVTHLSVFSLGSGPDRIVVGGYSAPSMVPLPTPLTDGGSLPLTYKIDGGVRLGTSVLPVRIDSPQLAQPLLVEFRLTTQRHPLLIVIIAAIGLIAGFLIRRVLVVARDRAAAVRRAADLATRLEDLIAAKADKPFHEKIKRALAPLRTVMLWRPAASTDTIVQDAERAANDALVKLRADLEAVAAQLPAYETIRRSWQVPVELRRRLTTAAQLLDQINKLLDVEDATSASRALAELQRHIDDSLVPEAIAAASQAINDASSLAAALSAHPDSPLAAVLPRVMRLQQTTAPSDGSSLPEVLTAVNRTEVETDAIRTHLLQTLATTVAAVSADQQDTAEAAAQEVRDALGRISPLAAVAGVLPQLFNVMEHGDEQLGDPDGAQAQTGDLEAVPRDPELIALTRRSFRWDRVTARPRETLATAVVIVTETVRFVLLTALLSVLAYSLFGTGWIGTFAQAIAVFTWAFAIDVGIEAVRTATGTGGPPQTSAAAAPPAAPTSRAPEHSPSS